MGCGRWRASETDAWAAATAARATPGSSPASEVVAEAGVVERALGALGAGDGVFRHAIQLRPGCLVRVGIEQVDGAHGQLQRLVEAVGNVQVSDPLRAEGLVQGRVAGVEAFPLPVTALGQGQAPAVIQPVGAQGQLVLRCAVLDSGPGWCGRRSGEPAMLPTSRRAVILVLFWL